MRAFRLPVVAPRPREVVFVPVDQLTDAVGPLARIPAQDTCVVLVETPAKAARRPYHQQKLALVLTSLRHFALEQAARGCEVVHLVDEHGYAPALERFARTRGIERITCMTPAERELRAELAPLVAAGLVAYVPHEGWLTTAVDFAAARKSERQWRMDAFYRAVRRRTGILMDGRGKPLGGRFSFDHDNRERWPGLPAAPERPRFAVDDVTREVGELVRARFGHHPGALDLGAIAATKDDVVALWAHARRACLPLFGPYEDALSHRSRTLFHTTISPYLNLHRLLPRDVVSDAAALPMPLASKEGFVRQVLGWREFVKHVHDATDGFRASGANGAPNALAQHTPLPPAYWPRGGYNPTGATSGLACLDDVVSAVWETGYSHHISRLMVLSNIAALLDVEPRALTDWFWAAYVDAYDWVVEPNVLAMGTWGAADTMVTKPYVSGAAYIDEMSDYCPRCSFSPTTKGTKKKPACPLTSMYWAYLQRHAAALAGIERLAMPLRAAAKRTPAQRASDDRVVQIVRRTLARGEPVTPAVLTPAVLAERS